MDTKTIEELERKLNERDHTDRPGLRSGEAMELLAIAKAHAATEARLAAEAWVPVAERLPNLYQEVLVWVTGDTGGVLDARYDGEGNWCRAEDPEYRTLGRVTHWRPLPQPPAVP